jgi:hypothetical protein
MTSFGIFMPGLRPAHTIKEGDDKVLQVRARRKVDLDRLRDKYMKDDLGESISLPYTDYEWRAYCTLEAWGRALALIAEDIDYVKFKETAEKVWDDHELHGAYLKVWSTLFSHFSSWEHQDDYWGQGLTGSVGKYGSTYPGTGTFSTTVGGGSYRKSKGKKGQKKEEGKYSSTGGGRQPWWADAENTGTSSHWWDDYEYYDAPDDEAGAQARIDAERDFEEELNSLKRGSGRQDSDINFENLYEMLEDLDPALKPVITADGQIDHLYCDHGISKSAKKRCRARWRRYAKQRVKREFGAVR